VLGEPVVKETEKTSMATGAVTIDRDEFLCTAQATFGVFQAVMPDGRTRDFLIYLVRGFEVCKFNHLKCMQQVISTTAFLIERNKLNAGPPGNGQCVIFRWIGYTLDTRKSRQVEDWSKKEKRHC
jgi:hypothetical protein